MKFPSLILRGKKTPPHSSNKNPFLRGIYSISVFLNAHATRIQIRLLPSLQLIHYDCETYFLPANDDAGDQSAFKTFIESSASVLRVGDGDFDFYAGLNADGGDLLDNLRRTVQVDQTLVDPHLEAIPSFGSLTAGGLPGGDAQSLTGRNAKRFSCAKKKVEE